MRIPVLGAALLSIVSLALLLRRLGFARAAVVAALLLAIHPWHVRYAIELRGYIFTLALFPLLLVLLLEALERRSWRWWIAYAFCGFCLLYANPVSFTALLVTNLAALIAILLRNHEPDGWNQLARWLVVNLVAAMLYLQLMLPCLPQLAAYLETAVSKGLLTERWHRNFYSHLYTGIPWNNSDSPLTGVPEFKWIAENSPLLFGVAFWVAGTLLGIGLVRLLLKKPVGWLVVAVFVIPGLITYGFARWKGNYLYEWYLIGSLPGLLAMVALGADAIAGRFQKLHTYAPPAILLTALLAYGLSTREARGWLLEHSIQPMKESVLHIRPNLDPYDPRQKEILTVRLNAPVRSYDPHAIPMDRVATLVATLRRADESNLPLYVNYGNLHSAAVDAPLLFRMIEDDRLFEKIATLPGYDPSLERFIRKYRPGAIETYPIPDGEK
jgi:hypothetical protein